MLSTDQQSYVKRLIAFSIEKNQYKIIQNDVINQIILKYEFNNHEKNSLQSFNIEEITEILTPEYDDNFKKNNGITFTSIPIVKFLLEQTISPLDETILEKKIADISVGNGAFFIGLIILLKEVGLNFSVANFIKNNLYGYDITKDNIEMLHLIFNLICFYYGEDNINLSSNLFVTDSLKYFQNNKKEKFDLVIGNPPYVKQQNIELDYRDFLLNNFNSINSNYNLYYAFVEVSLDILKKNGKSVLLIPNYLLKIKSAETLRNYLIKGDYISRIIDFRDNKMFTDIDSYTMIIELKKDVSKKQFKLLDNEQTLEELSKEEWKPLLNNQITHNSINLVCEKENQLINSVSGQLYSLDISTGIATQKDKLYIIDEVIDSDNPIFYKLLDNVKYPIEKELVVKLYRGSGQKKYNIKSNYIIYPYTLNHQNVAQLIPVNILEKKYPNAYKYFLAAKEGLLTRSGAVDNEEWYKYGRTQALNRFEEKILFPTNTLKPNFNLIKEKALFHNGYAIYGLSNHDFDINDLEVLTILLNSDIIEQFMKLISYFIGGGYVSYQKKYIEQITVPYLNEEEKKQIKYYYKQDEIYELNNYIYSLYDLNYNDYK